MAGSPQFKVYDPDGVLQATARDATIAAGIIGAAGWEGWTVKFGGRLIWREGEEAVLAGDTADGAADEMYSKIRQHERERRERLGYR